MKTGNYQTAGKLTNAVSISRGKPNWFTGRTYDALAPAWWMMKLERHAFEEAYREKILKSLDPAKVMAELGLDVVLLCWEPFNTYCHRRLVAEWLEQQVGIEVPEFGFARHESLTAAEMPMKGEKKPKLATQLLIF